jgi:hypothetical protein
MRGLFVVITCLALATCQWQDSGEPLPWYQCPCREGLWREFMDSSFPEPALVSMAVRFPYSEQEMNQTLQVKEVLQNKDDKPID